MPDANRGVLFIGDETNVAEQLGDILAAGGYQCQKAATAGEAVTVLGQSPVDLVLLDIQAPGKIGTDLLPEILALYPGTQVIVVSDMSGLDIATKAVGQGAYDYVIKPLNPDEVLNCLRRAFEKKRLETELREYREHVEQKIEDQAREMNDLFAGAMAALTFTLEASDEYTAEHSRRVTDISLAIGRKSGLKEDELTDLRWGSLLHDIGKTAIARKIVNKKGKLNPDEYGHVMTHPMIGASVVGAVVNNKRITEIIEYHHEHYNGSGFNQKLEGKQIPFLARIVAIADAFDAMTSNRPYRQAFSRQEALNEIRYQAGRQFDPALAELFLGMRPEELAPEKRKILVVDDEEAVRLLVRSSLSTEFCVIEAKDGAEGVLAARNEKPSLIFMDIMMPVKDGFEACYEIKTDDITKSIPLVMFTVIDQDLNRKQSVELGADGYLTKPFTPKNLLDAVNKFSIY